MHALASIKHLCELSHGDLASVAEENVNSHERDKKISKEGKQ